MDLTTATPVEIDTTLAEIYGRLYAEYDAIHRLDGFIRDMESGLAKYQAGDLSYSSFTQEALDRLLNERDAHQAKSIEIMDETRPYQDEYRRRPWSRFHLVKNNGGHIHSSMSCSTCYPTTQFGWLPQLSGQTEAEAVAAHGAILCTVCYPSAPVEYTDRRDPSACPGSGTWDYPSDTARTGYYTGNYGVCTHCGERVTISKTGKMRKHKRPA